MALAYGKRIFLVLLCEKIFAAVNFLLAVMKYWQKNVREGGFSLGQFEDQSHSSRSRRQLETRSSQIESSIEQTGNGAGL